MIELYPLSLPFALRAPDTGEGSTAPAPDEAAARETPPPTEEVVDSSGGGEPGQEPQEQEAKPSEPSEPPKEKEPPAPKTDEETRTTPAWVMPRINKLSGRVRELEEQLARGVDSKAGGAPPLQEAPVPEGHVRIPDGRVLSYADLQQEITRQAALTQLNVDLVKMVDKGNSEFPDFQQSIATLRDGIGIMTQPFLEAILETGEAHKVLHALANDADKASYIATLSPVRQAVAVAKFASDLNKAPSVSRAPAPVGKERVRGSAKVALELDDPGVPMDEFMKKRNAHEAELRKNGQWR